MAKKRKHKSHRRRMGASKESPVMSIVGAVVGAIAGRLISNKVTTLNPKIMAAIQAVGGGVLVYKAKSSLVKGLGIGLATSGAIAAGQSFGLLNGIGYAGKYTIPFAADNNGINGFSNVPGIGNADQGYSYPQPSAIGEIGSLIG